MNIKNITQLVLAGTFTFLAAALVLPASADQYDVIIRTSDRSGAGTDSNVWLKLHGTEKNSLEIRVQDKTSGDILEAGESDIFRLEGDWGTITSLEVESKGDYSGAAWHLEEIEIKRYVGSAYDEIWSTGNFFLRAQKEQELRKQGKVIMSTFKADRWFPSEERSDPNPLKVTLKRSESPVAAEGEAERVNSNIYIVYSADGLDSEEDVPRNWSSTITESQALTFEDTTTNRVQVGASAEYGQEGNAGVSPSWKVSLSVEYEHLAESKVGESYGTEISETRDESFKASPGNLEFRILVGSGTLETQRYRSTLSGETFTATLASPSADFNPRQVSFTNGQLDDDKWNRSVARPYVLAKGKAGYDSMVRRLKSMGCLENPYTADEALGKVRTSGKRPSGSILNIKSLLNR